MLPTLFLHFARRTATHSALHSPLMKKYKCIFNSKDKHRRILISGLKMESLTQPITITLKEEVLEEAPRPTKRRSEVVEEEADTVERVYEVSDAENRVYVSRRVDLSSNYFAFINVGSSLRIVPISELQRFNLKSAYNEVLEDIVLPDIDVREKDEEVEEIDYQEKFDDDNSEDEIEVSVEKKLSKAGRKMKSLMKTYEDEEQGVRPEDLRDILSKGKVTLMELINDVKLKFRIIDEKAKEVIRIFIKDECEIAESAEGKQISLKR